jgi:hypothetical protein
MVTTPLALAGDAAPALWLIVARVGALLAVVGAWRLGARLGGRAGAVGASGVMLAAPWWLYNGALGNSEGWLAAAVLWAIVSHLEGRVTVALVLATVAGLLRPEIWPFLGIYGAWAWRLGVRRATVACALVVLIAWFGPDIAWHAGAVNAGSSARATPSPASAALADDPALQVLADTATGVGVVACVLAALGAWRSRTVLALVALALGYVLIVVVSTAAGWAGNPRYLVPALALLAVAAGVGAARLPWSRLVVAVLVAATLGGHADDLRTSLRDVGQRDDARRGLDAALAAAGGPGALRRCGPVRTVFLSRALVALRADVPLPTITDPTRDGSTLLSPPPSVLQDQRPVPERGPAGQRLVVRAGGWTVWSSCPVWSRDGPAPG